MAADREGQASIVLRALLNRVQAATGRDRKIDQDILNNLDEATPGQPVPEYTSSVDLCLALIEQDLPEWHWHVGYGPNGVIPYAFVENDQVRFEAQASTVPLALLTVLLKARLYATKGG